MPKIKRNIYNQLVPALVLVANDLVLVVALFPLLPLSGIILRPRRLASSVSSPSPVAPKMLPSRPRLPPPRLPVSP
jgi:hypothetical protein